MAETYWVRLNQTPVANLSALDGSLPSWQQEFDKIAGGLKKQMERDRLGYQSPLPHCPEWTTLWESLKEVKGRLRVYAQMLWMDPSCTLHPPQFQWSVSELPQRFIGDRQMVYADRCPNSQRTETFPLPLQAVYAVDWDKDGDQDLAVQLINGQYIFYRRENCPDKPKQDGDRKPVC